RLPRQARAPRPFRARVHRRDPRRRRRRARGARRRAAAVRRPLSRKLLPGPRRRPGAARARPRRPPRAWRRYRAARRRAPAGGRRRATARGRVLHLRRSGAHPSPGGLTTVDLTFTDEQLAFRDELRDWLQANLPGERPADDAEALRWSIDWQR